MQNGRTHGHNKEKYNILHGDSESTTCNFCLLFFLNHYSERKGRDHLELLSYPIITTYRILHRVSGPYIMPIEKVKLKYRSQPEH